MSPFLFRILIKELPLNDAEIRERRKKIYKTLLGEILCFYFIALILNSDSREGATTIPKSSKPKLKQSKHTSS